MGYTFTIGRPAIETDTVVGDPVIDPRTQPVSQVVDDPTSVHADEYEGSPYEGSAKRSVSYTVWSNICDIVTELGLLWDDMESRYSTKKWVPVKYYEHRLDAIESEAEQLLDGEPRVSKSVAEQHDPFDNPVLEQQGSETASAALRALWFVRWSREAQNQFDEMAVFEVPGEWK